MWRDKLHAGGTAKLLAPAVGLGRPPKLSTKQKTELVARLREPASISGCADDKWTTARVRALLVVEFGFTFTLPGLHRMLRRLGFEFSRKRGWTVRGRSPSRTAPWGLSYDDGGRIMPNETEQRASDIARHLDRKGTEIAAIVRVLRESGFVGRDGRPISPALVEAILARAKRTRSAAACP